VFAAFSAEQLNPEEAALFPPLFVHVDGRTLEQNDIDILFEILGAGLPIKILVTLVRTLDGNQTRITDTPFNQWPGQLAGPAIALNSTFVLQASASLIPLLQGAVAEGFRFDGPALFCVYTGSEDGSKQLHPFIQTSAALESRVFPTLLYFPGTGMEWASRFSIKANPQINRDWMEQEITYETSPGQTSTLRLPFTVADYLACDRRFGRHFMWVPKNKWHRDMLPFGNYLKLDETERDKIPIILMADKKGVLSAVVVSAEVVRVTEDILDRWHMLKELGGIENSFVKQALEDEQKWLAEQKQKAFEEAREQFETEWNRTTGELAQEIVSNIATGLLNRPLFGSEATPTVVAEDRIQTEPKPTPPPADSHAPADQEEEEEEMLSFDAAYIESPLCASCNECLSINEQMFEYNDNDQAYIKDVTAGTYRDLVDAAESCPEKIIHPGQPINPDESGLDDLRKRAEPFL